MIKNTNARILSIIFLKNLRGYLVLFWHSKKLNEPPTPKGEYIRGNLELGTFLKKISQTLSYFGCTPL
jgi:hypothetical protein